MLFLFFAEVAIVKWNNGGIYDIMEEGIKKKIDADVYSMELGHKRFPPIKDYKVVIGCGYQTIKKLLKHYKGYIVGLEILPEDSIIINKRICGVYINPDFMKILEIIRKALPDIKKIGFIYNPLKSSKIAKKVEDAISSFGLQAEKATAKTPGEVGAAIRFMEGIDLFLIIPDENVMQDASFKFILMTSYSKKFPIYGITKKYVKAGALLSLSPDYSFMGEKAGEMAKRLLNGERPEKVGKINPKGRIVVNLKIAHKLGIYVSENLLAEAKEVYK